MVNGRMPFQAPKAMKRKILHCIPLIKLKTATDGLWQCMKLINQRCTQSLRLMVGVRDYANYVRHLRQYHPERPPMSEREFHRYCLEARFPSKAGKLGKCPC